MVAIYHSRWQRQNIFATVAESTCVQEKCSIVFVPTRKHARLTAMDILAFAAADGQPGRFLQVHGLTSLVFWSSSCFASPGARRLGLPIMLWREAYHVKGRFH